MGARGVGRMGAMDRWVDRCGCIGVLKGGNFVKLEERSFFL